MAEAPAVIELGDPNYEAIYALYQAQRGKVIVYAGAVYRMTKENALFKFVKVGNSGVDAAYASNSIPPLSE